MKFSIPIEEPLPGIPRIWGVQIETQHVKAAALEMLLLFQSFPTLCDPMDCSMPGFPVPHHLLKFTQVHVCYFGDAIQPSHPLMPSSPSALNLSQHQGLFRVICLHQMSKTLELQLQHQSFQQILGLISLKIDWFDILAIQGTFRSLLQHHSSKASILWCSTFTVQL